MRTRPAVQLAVLGDRRNHLPHQEVDAAIGLFPAEVEANWIATDSTEARDLTEIDGVWLVSGGPYRDDACVLAAVEWCIDSPLPFLGTCSGFQYACLALARRHGVNAEHAERDPSAADPLITPLTCSLYSEERSIVPVTGTRFAAICGEQPFPGFHSCGYGLAPRHERTIERAGAVIAARADDAGVEAIELPNHPFFLATAFQPQVGTSRTQRLHPLLQHWVEGACARHTVEQH